MSGTAGTTTAVRRGSAGVLSSSTYAFVVIAILLVAVFIVASAPGVLDEDTALTVADIGSFAINGLAAAMVWIAALSYSRGRTRTVWTLVAVGLTCFAIGDAVWSYVELALLQDPYPSASDVFYTAEYFFVAAALILTALSYRGFVSFRRAFAVAAAAGAAGLAIVYFTVLQPYILPATTDELEPLAKFVSVMYPVADVLLFLVPAVFTLTVILRLGSGRFAWAWWLVVAGALVFAVGDTVYSYADWSGIYEQYYWAIDPTWIIANLMFALAAMVARDAYRV